MNCIIRAVLCANLSAATGFAATFLFGGTFAADNQVGLYNFTANSPELISIQTYGYAGGTVNTFVIPGGGFAPVAYIFDNAGGMIPLTNGSCSQVGQDPTTQGCNDIFYQNTFGPGVFTLALAVADNRPVDNFLAHGFTQDSNPGFTCQSFGTSGSFCDATTALGFSRTGSFAASISGADDVSQISAPEPSTWALLLAGCALIFLRRTQCGPISIDT